MPVRLLVIAFLLALGNVAPAGVLWDEDVNGGLSGDNFSPTDLGELTMGSSTVKGQIGQFSSDHFTVEVAAGTFLQSLFLDAYDDPNPNDNDRNMFMALVEGDSFPDDYFALAIDMTVSGDDYLGGAIVGRGALVNGSLVGDDVGTDILDDLGAGFIGQGFAAPLGPGQYTFLAQQTNGFGSGYTLNFNVTAVPEPTSMLPAALVMGLIGFRRRRNAAA